MRIAFVVLAIGLTASSAAVAVAHKPEGGAPAQGSQKA